MGPRNPWKRPQGLVRQPSLLLMGSQRKTLSWRTVIALAEGQATVWDQGQCFEVFCSHAGNIGVAGIQRDPVLLKRRGAGEVGNQWLEMGGSVSEGKFPAPVMRIYWGR